MGNQKPFFKKKSLKNRLNPSEIESRKTMTRVLEGEFWKKDENLEADFCAASQYRFQAWFLVQRGLKEVD